MTESTARPDRRDAAAVARHAVSTLRSRSDLVALGLIVASTLVFPRRSPLGVYGLGVVTGSLLALNAIGLVLVYRSNRIINFAQVAVGGVGATLFAASVTYQPLLRWGLKYGVFETEPTWFVTANYWVSAVLGLALSVLLGWAVHALVVRRFTGAPPLVATVTTIFVVSVCGLLSRQIRGSRLLRSTDQIDANVGVGAPAPPFRVTLDLPGVRMTSRDLLVVAVVAITIPLLTLYFRRTSTGVVIRAAADNPMRVATLGVDVNAVVGRVWAVAALLSGLAAILTTMGSGPPPDGVDINVGLMVRILAVAVIARLVSLPVAGAAAIGLGVLEETMLFSFRTPLLLDALLVAVIGAVLMLQRATAVRADVDSTGSWRAAREVRPIPRELRGLPEVRRWLRIGAAAAAIAALGAPWVLSPSQTDLAAYVVIATMMFTSVLVLTGWAGQISLGQLAFAAIGAWITAVSGWPFPVAVAAGALGGGVAAVVVGIPALKLRGLHLAIMTLAFSLAVSTLVLNPRYLGKHLPSDVTRPTMLGMDLDDGRVFYYVLLALLAVVVGAVAGLRRSAVARALIAARDNEAAAQGFGVNLLRARLQAFAVSGVIAGFAGSLLAYQQSSVIPESYSAGQSLQVFLYAVIGGLGAVSAPLVAGAYFAVVTVFDLPAGLVQLMTGAGGVVLLMIATGGLAQVGFDTRDSLLRAVARRRKIVVPSLLADARDAGLADVRLAITPKRRRGGGTEFVPARYRLDDQYGIPAPGAKTAEPTGAPRG